MNKKIIGPRRLPVRWLMTLAMGLGAPSQASAQEETPPVQDAAPAEATAVEQAAPAEAAAPLEDAATTDESASTPASASGADETAAETPAEEGGGTGRPLYVGVEFAQTKIELADKVRAKFGARRFDSDFYKLRLGVRLFDGLGFEFQGGVPGSNASGNDLETSQYYGLYLAPTGVLFETLEVSARIGYSFMSIESDDADKDLDGVGYALALELPLRRLAEGLPDFRLTAAAEVYQGDREARVYGYSVGLRYDFHL